jgi:DNA transposition AAA+ family ATPase
MNMDTEIDITATEIDNPDAGPEPAAEVLETNAQRQGANARATWRFSGDHVQQGLAHCTPERKEVLIWCFNWCIKRAIAFADFAKQVGYAENTLWKIFNGRHTDPGTGAQYDVPEKLWQAAADFRKLELRKAKLGETEFVVTPTARRIWDGCDLARESRTPVFIYGASHIGKTWALRYYTLENNHGRTVMVRVPAKAGLAGLVKAMAEAVGVSSKANTPAMVERIKRALAPNHVVILDEVHQLQYTYRKDSFFGCIEVIREIYDFVECGFVLATTNAFRSRFESARKEELEQLFKRGVHQVQLGDIVRAEDLKPILATVGLEWPGRRFTVEIAGIKDQPHEVLRKLAREGGLKSITERIRYGRRLAAGRKEPLSWAHFIHAHLIIETGSQEPADDWQ